MELTTLGALFQELEKGGGGEQEDDDDYDDDDDDYDDDDFCFRRGKAFIWEVWSLIK